MEDNNKDMAKEDNTKESKTSSFIEALKYALLALIIVIPFRIFIAQPYIVSGSSMDPTFHDGDYLIVDQLSKNFKDIDRKSVVIIRYPKDPSKFFIKRLIAFPNETVSINEGKVTIYNEKNEKITLEDEYVKFPKNEDFERRLGENEYFVMGDNRAGSSDSRAWGPVSKEGIIGVPILRLLPMNRIGLNPGKSS